MSERSWTSNTSGIRICFQNTVVDTLVQELVAISAPAQVFVLCGKSSPELVKQVVQRLEGESEKRFKVAVIAKAQQHTPQNVIDEIRAEVFPNGEARAAVLLAVGGGSAIGVAKALALSAPAGSEVPIACIPTTYSGSEMTNISGVTVDGRKTTVRDSARVLPRLVLYDPLLCQSMDKDQALTSAFNALAHAVEALWDQNASPVSLLMAEEAVRVVIAALAQIRDGKLAYNDAAVCRELLYGSHLCGASLNACAMGVHHKLAHVLGGQFGLPHSRLHTVLLPHSIAFNRSAAPTAMATLCKAIGKGCSDPARFVWDLQKDLGVPTRLGAIGFKFDDITRAAQAVVDSLKGATGYTNPRPIEYDSLLDVISRAHHGRRPRLGISARADILSQPPAGLHCNPLVPVALGGCPIELAEYIVICVHGRFASAEGVMRQLDGVLGEGRDRLAIIAPNATDAQWYNGSFVESLAKLQPGFVEAQHVIRQCHDFALKFVAASRIFLFGFSQGACLALTYCLSRFDSPLPANDAQRSNLPPLELAGVIALSGGVCGDANDVEAYDVEAKNSCLAGLRIILGCANEDSHVPIERVKLTLLLLQARGAHVQHDFFPGGEHKIFPASATKARALFAEVTASGNLIGGNGTVSGGAARKKEGGSKNSGGARERVDSFEYLAGYMSLLESEALPGAVPRAQRSPHHVPYGLYAECVTGSPFCAPRSTNLSTWMYRIHPSIGTHGAFKPYAQQINNEGGFAYGGGVRGDFCCPGNSFTPEPARWKPTPIRAESHDFVDGLVTLAGTGNPMSVKGMAIHVYTCNKDMVDRAFYCADGDFLIVPELGDLRIQTEFGFLVVSPGEFFILPRGLKMSVSIIPRNDPSARADSSTSTMTTQCRGFACELYEVGHFQLPNLGPIGSNGLADARHFKVPTAYYEDRAVKDYELIAKFGGSLFLAHLQYSPYDVVGWSGRYHPSKYHLLQFMALGSVTWDHADPSLQTVLTCPIDPSTSASACDIVCFRSRFDAARHTFRPPWYHRNVATEFNLIIELPQSYSGFEKGSYWLTPTLSAHGISGDSFNSFMAREASDEAHWISEGSIWMMFESIYPMVLTEAGAAMSNREGEYPRNFFTGVPRTFTGPQYPPSTNDEASATVSEKTTDSSSTK